MKIVKSRLKILILLICLLGVTAVIINNANYTLAQTPESVWSDPINLSKSGAAFASRSVKMANGDVHLLWRDQAANQFVYTQQAEGAWSEPVPVELPFGTRVYYPDLGEDDPTPLFTPQLVADAEGFIHAFWLDEENALYHSQVQADSVTDFALWTPRQLVAAQASQFAPVVDERDQVHIIYIRPITSEEFPAGVYHRRNSGEVQVTEGEEEAQTGESFWSLPVLLYDSPYYRQHSEVTIDLVTSQDGENILYAVWDNKSLDKVFFSRSRDGGESWAEPVEIDKREESDDPGGEGPSQIQISAYGETVLLLWQANHGSLFCSLFYTWSDDAGTTWEVREPLLPDQQSCPEQRLLIDTESELHILAARFGEITSFLAWQDGRWARPLIQPEMAGFVDPETNRRLNFIWREMKVINGNELLVIGGDEGQNDNVWQLTRALGDANDWFPPPSPWSANQLVTESETDVDGLTMTAEEAGNIYLAWTQTTSLEDNSSAIYFSRWDGEQWSRPASVLTSPTGLQTLQPDIAAGGNGRVFIVWRNELGELFISQAPGARSEISAEWSDPQPLPILEMSAKSPDVIYGPDDRIYVNYALTLNEDRGVYLVHSDDGLSWSEPITVFDATAAGWDMVDEPKLLMSDFNTLHTIWTRYTLPPDSGALGLYYALSNDKGETWSPPELIVNGVIQWSALEGLEGYILHRIWQEVGRSETDYWHQLSLDNGISWEQEERISALEALTGPTALTIDPAGRLHMVIVEDKLLTHYFWEDGRWTRAEALELTEGTKADNQNVSAAVSTSGELVSAYTGNTFEPTTEASFGAIFMTGQQLTLPDVTPPAIPTSTPTPEPTATATAVPSPSPTPRVQFDVDQIEEEPPLGLPILNNSMVRLVLSVIPVLILVILVVIIGGRAIWIGRR